ncbi:histidinol-phosphatase HisJ [Companilactobacillus halodurans]|uniref:histidinol-phosphatase HisJ n=1 Tax=Companilactobacillus halodurans TaxID=2584183 RepID=UPI001EE20FC2|nr:histidinol-phosphatase HisJ [Companilactobacillus halodurans]
MFDKDLPTDLKTWNGHTHTEFCPHGSREDTELFIQQAIQSGFKTYTITEHFPMPKEFYENVAGSKHAIETAAMQFSELPAYFEKMNYLKAKYADKIKILIGFEVDYFEEFRDWTESMLAKYADEIDDAILSVHFLPTDHGLRAVDDSFGCLIRI